jgi:ATPase
MVEQDLARPVIEISDFESGLLEYEIYTFGEENVIVPVTESETQSGVHKLAAEKIRETMRRFDPNPKIEILSDNRVKVMVKKDSIPSLIGKGGSTISELEKILHVHIDVVEKESDASHESQERSGGVRFDFSESANSLMFDVDKRYNGALAEIYVNDRYVATSRVARHGKIKISKRSDEGKALSRLASSKSDIEIVIKDF